ncbi:MAG: metallophosphoesterase [Abitibacteriaceae bacterium]|nr:metallophosphoesterase [Abditibacteriaceae bacterium]
MHLQHFYGIWLLLFICALPGAAQVVSPTNQEAQTIRIALVSDTHTTRGTAEDQPLYKGRFDKVIEAVNAANVSLVLIAGDLTQGGHDEEIADFKDQIKKLHAPILYVPGNHDVGDKILPTKPGGVTAKRVEHYETLLGAAFFEKEQAGVRVVGLTASLLGSGLPREAEQWTFLEKALAKPAKLPTLLLMHYPLFLKTPDEPSDPYWNVEPQPRARLLALLQSGGVRAVLSGHLHRPLINHYNGILLASSPPVSFGLPRGKQPQGWTLITVSPQQEVNAEFQYIAD